MYWLCNPPGIGTGKIRPTVSTGRVLTQCSDRKHQVVSIIGGLHRRYGRV
jgi:hypothetical protein